MAGTNEERYKAAMANAVKTIKSQKEHIAALEAKLAASEERVDELEETLEAHGLPVPGKRKRDDTDGGDDMDVEGGGGGKKAGRLLLLPLLLNIALDIAEITACFISQNHPASLQTYQRFPLN